MPDYAFRHSRSEEVSYYSRALPFVFRLHFGHTYHSFSWFDPYKSFIWVQDVSGRIAEEPFLIKEIIEVSSSNSASYLWLYPFTSAGFIFKSLMNRVVWSYFSFYLAILLATWACFPTISISFLGISSSPLIVTPLPADLIFEFWLYWTNLQYETVLLITHVLKIPLAWRFAWYSLFFIVIISLFYSFAIQPTILVLMLLDWKRETSSSRSCLSSLSHKGYAWALLPPYF